MQKLQDSMDGLLSRTDLGEYERARHYVQLQNKYLTFKQQLNSRRTESSLPYSVEQRQMSSNLLVDNVPVPIHEPVTGTVSPVQEQVLLHKRLLFKTYQYKRSPFKTSDFTSNSYESLASLIYLDTPSHKGSTFAKKAKMTSNPVCNLLRGR